MSQWPKWLRRQYGKLEICGSSPGYDTSFSLKLSSICPSDIKFFNINVKLTFLQRYHDDGDEFLDWIITGDETWVAHPRNQTAVNALASKWISLQDEIHADYVCMESDVHSVVGQTVSNPRRENFTT